MKIKSKTKTKTKTIFNLVVDALAWSCIVGTFLVTLGIVACVWHDILFPSSTYLESQLPDLLAIGVVLGIASLGFGSVVFLVVKKVRR